MFKHVYCAIYYEISPLYNDIPATREAPPIYLANLHSSPESMLNCARRDFFFKFAVSSHAAIIKFCGLRVMTTDNFGVRVRVVSCYDRTTIPTIILP